MKQTLILIVVLIAALSTTCNAQSSFYKPAIRDSVTIINNIDTIPSILLISYIPPSFAHSINGYCITNNDVCTGHHLVYRSKRKWIFGRRTWRYLMIGDEYSIYGCSKVKRNNQPNKK